MPKTPEELRSQLRLVGHAWTFVKLRYMKSWLADMSPAIRRKYADFILGTKVYGMPLPEGSNYHLPWSIVLAYELEIRRDAYRRVCEDRITIAVALEEACKDAYLRDIHL
eukprot:1185998-Karenia_brevis.AAC.1